ncbi:MAG: hypothetical protein K2O54_05765, partial [Prevotella sp.]|nr:hypothetical protein [Prevotella sp.]
PITRVAALSLNCRWRQLGNDADFRVNGGSKRVVCRLQTSRLEASNGRFSTSFAFDNAYVDFWFIYDKKKRALNLSVPFL